MKDISSKHINENMERIVDEINGTFNILSEKREKQLQKSLRKRDHIIFLEKKFDFTKINNIKKSSPKFCILFEIWKGNNSNLKIKDVTKEKLSRIDDKTWSLKKRGYLLAITPRVNNYKVYMPRLDSNERKKLGIKTNYPKLFDLTSGKIEYDNNYGFEGFWVHHQNNLYDDSDSKSPYLKKHLETESFQIDWDQIMRDLIDEKNYELERSSASNNYSELLKSDFDAITIEVHLQNNLFKLVKKEKTLEELYKAYLNHLKKSKKKLLKEKYGSLRDWIEAMTQ